MSCALKQVSDLSSQRSFKWGEIGVLISASLSMIVKYDNFSWKDNVLNE